MSKEKTCEERIDESMQNVEVYLNLCFIAREIGIDNLDPEDEDDFNFINMIASEGINEDSINEFAFGITTHKVIRIELSGGGPSSYIEAKLDEDNNVISATYHFLDWFDGAVRKINPSSNLFKYVEYYAEMEKWRD